tara:strand:- start:1956 stop:2675 length:720 start_codon:yes stop_codon:yes gene_type:complete
MHKNWRKNLKRIVIFISVGLFLSIAYVDFNQFLKHKKERPSKYEIFGNNYIPDSIIIQKINKDKNYNSIYDYMIKDLKIVEGSDNLKIILIEENDPIFYDQDYIYISSEQYIDFDLELKQKDELLFLQLEIENQEQYFKAIKKIASITKHIDDHYNDLYSSLESVVYDQNKFLNLYIDGCAIKLMKIPYSFSNLNLQDIKDKLYNLQSFIDNENKDISSIEEIDLRWENEGYIVWEDKF